MTLKSGDKGVLYELVFFVSFVLFCFFFLPRMYAGRKLRYMPLDTKNVFLTTAIGISSGGVFLK